MKIISWKGGLRKNKILEVDQICAEAVHAYEAMEATHA